MADKLFVSVDGVRSVTRALKLMNTETKARCHAAVDASLTEAVAQAKARVPKRTGELENTIRKSIQPVEPVGWLLAGFGSLKRRVKGTNKRSKNVRARRKATQGPVEPGIYAMVVEFGDARRNKPAEPYISPAVESTRPHHNARIAAAVQGAVAAVERGS